MYNYKARLNRVIDGDTVILDIDLGFDVSVKQRVRLADIDTPELRGSSELEKKAATASKEVLEKLFHHNVEIRRQEIIIDSKKTKFDQWNRYVAYISVGDVNVNKYMLEEGYAKEFDGNKVEWTEEELKKILSRGF